MYRLEHRADLPSRPSGGASAPGGGYEPPMGGYDPPMTLRGFQGLGPLKKILQKKCCRMVPSKVKLETLPRCAYSGTGPETFKIEFLVKNDIE